VSCFDLLDECKRGTYGPLGLLKLMSGRWAVVWWDSVRDEEACQRVLAEDPTWFNESVGDFGRPPNPTYPTQLEALEEIIRLLISPALSAWAPAAVPMAEEDMLTPLDHFSQSASYVPECGGEGDHDAAGGRRKPWEDVSERGKGVSIQTSPELYAKMKWITENVPKMSFQRIVRQGAEAEADRLIAEHYHDPE
jgi:hypothetical protein